MLSIYLGFRTSLTYDKTVDILCYLCIVAERQRMCFLSVTHAGLFPLLKY